MYEYFKILYILSVEQETNISICQIWICFSFTSETYYFQSMINDEINDH